MDSKHGRINLLAVIGCGIQLLAWMAPLASGQTQCVQRISQCQCQTKSGKYIDLLPLASRSDYRFKKIKGPTTWLYSYNPCFGFQCEGAGDVASCQNDPTVASYEYALGTEDTATFGYNLKLGLYLQYTSSHTSTTRISLVRLICSPTDDVFTPNDNGILSDTNVYTYSSTLTSKHACEVDSMPEWLGGGGGVSAGDVLLIIFFVGIVLYLAVGVAVNVLVLKKPLGPDALPNAGFWVALIGYIREGAVFCWAKVRQLTMRKGAYQDIK